MPKVPGQREEPSASGFQRGLHGQGEQEGAKCLLHSGLGGEQECLS